MLAGPRDYLKQIAKPGETIKGPYIVLKNVCKVTKILINAHTQ